MNEVIRRDFPLTRPEVGMLLANGTVGAAIWGQENTLRISLNRSDFWLHKGGMGISDEAKFGKIRELAESRHFRKLDALLEPARNGSSKPQLPTLLPLGRIDLVFPKDTTLKTGYLHLKTGKVVIDVVDSHGSYQLHCYMAMDKPLLDIHFPPNRDVPRTSCVTAWNYSASRLEALGLERPAMIDEPPFSGWVQKRPGDDALCVGVLSDKSDIFCALRYGDSADESRDRVRKMLDKAKKSGSDAFRAAGAAFWANHWRWVPHIDIPNETLSFFYYYGTYIFASLTTPAGVVPTMYGPWIDENRDPPFVGGYQGTVNLRMCYWPAFRTNLMHHCRPLFAMVDSWKERMREQARKVFGIEDGVLLPSFVDDRCTRITGTWPGIVDPGAACFIAELMYRYYLYTQDTEFLRSTAWPFMIAVMNVYETMLEKTETGCAIPFGVSPAFRGNPESQWGRNPGFQLACIAFLAESLITAATVLDEKPRKSWEEILASLPKTASAGLTASNGKILREFGVFDGVPLQESAAFHSHLASIIPFDTLNIDSKELSAEIERTIETWVAQGTGAWNSTSLPWASMIHTRLGNADMAELLLEVWQRVFTNEANSAVRDPVFMGFSTRSTPESVGAAKNETLHMDGFMAATAAILEMLVHTRRGVNYLFAGAPKRWKFASFDNIRTEGAFEVGAARQNGKVTRVSVKANAAGTFRLANPWGGKAVVQRSKGTGSVQGTVLEIPMAADERIELTGE